MNTIHVVPVAALLLSIALYAAAVSAENAEAYLFPRLLALCMCLISAMMVAAVLVAKLEHTGPPKPFIPWRRLWPALLIMIAFLIVAQDLGFYTSSWVAFLILATIYAPGSTLAAGSTIRRRLVISLIFIGVLYSMFALLLRVQTPTGLLF